MGVLEDLQTAFNQYPDENVTISVINFVEPEIHINVDEQCTFNVRVQNSGHLDLRNVILHIVGSEFASLTATRNVWGNPVNFTQGSSFSESRNIDADDNATFGPIHMRADAATPDAGEANRDLFTIHISTFDVDLDHILRDHSHHAGSPEEVYNRHIHRKYDSDQ